MTAKEKALLRDFCASTAAMSDLVELILRYAPLDVLGVIHQRLVFLEQRKVGRPRKHATDQERWRAGASMHYARNSEAILAKRKQTRAEKKSSAASP